jgi:hypothetical protein
VAAGDVDGDGALDLAVSNRDSNTVSLFVSQASAACSAADLAEPLGVLNFFDVSAYLALFNAQDPAADLAAPAGVINFFDLSAYLDAFSAGCP